MLCWTAVGPIQPSAKQHHKVFRGPVLNADDRHALVQICHSFHEDAKTGKISLGVLWKDDSRLAPNKDEAIAAWQEPPLRKEYENKIIEWLELGYTGDITSTEGHGNSGFY